MGSPTVTEAMACSNPMRHTPWPHTLQVHHSPPRSWTIDNGVSSDKFPLCGTCHDNAHALLNLFVHASGVPSRKVLRTFNPFIVSICKQAWARRRNDHPPYTTIHGQAV